jgi:hypothetical protein
MTCAYEVRRCRETERKVHPLFHRMRVTLLLLIPLAGCLDAVRQRVGVPAPAASSEVALRRVFSTG